MHGIDCSGSRKQLTSLLTNFLSPSRGKERAIGKKKEEQREKDRIKFPRSIYRRRRARRGEK